MLSVRLSVQRSVLDNDRELDRLPSSEPVELFCYLLLQRERLHSHHVPASLLAGLHIHATTQLRVRPPYRP